MNQKEDSQSSTTTVFNSMKYSLDSNIYQDIGITFFDESTFHVIERMTINLVKVSLCHKNILHDYMSNKAPNILFLPSDF